MFNELYYFLYMYFSLVIVRMYYVLESYYYENVFSWNKQQAQLKLTCTVETVISYIRKSRWRVGLFNVSLFKVKKPIEV